MSPRIITFSLILIRCRLDNYKKNFVFKLKHDDYNVNSNLNDIAIIQLSSEAKLSQSIQVACLPSPEKGLYPTTSGMDVWAMGFGALNSDGPSPDTLYNVKMTLYDGATQCRRVAPRTPKNWDSQICAGI